MKYQVQRQNGFYVTAKLNDDSQWDATGTPLLFDTKRNAIRFALSVVEGGFVNYVRVKRSGIPYLMFKSNV
jgi:hypothetical protein